jgi:DNA-binding response OmpR family regulator
MPSSPPPHARRFLANMLRLRGAAGPRPPTMRADPVGAPSAPVPATNPGKRAKVVVVAEDDLETRKLLVQSLGKEYRVFEAADGHAVLQVLAGIDRPDVVILDINMPRLDGLGVAMMIKENPNLKDVPIIFLTCMDTPTDVIRGIQAGARNYITKPFAISGLKEKVGRASRRSS